MTISQTTLATLHRADGSATYSHGGYTIIGAVNGPIEVQRRDEIPDEAAIEVNVRPAVGVGGPRERHLETLLHSTLRHIILVYQHPRSLIQITLQVLSTPDETPTSHIPLLPPLLNAAVPALLHAGVPMSGVPAAALVSTSKDGAVVVGPVAKARAVHALAFVAPEGELVLAESEGGFAPEDFEAAVEMARRVCVGGSELGEEEGMVVDGDGETVVQSIRRAVVERLEGDEGWRDGAD